MENVAEKSEYEQKETSLTQSIDPFYIAHKGRKIKRSTPFMFK